MIKLENTEVLGWEAAIRGMRNPMNSWDKSDSGWKLDYPEEAIKVSTDGEEYYDLVIGPNDQKLMMNLAKASSVDAKYRRMIVVTVDIAAPLYWWKEFDTYKIGTVANSCSTMHKIHSKEFTLDDFSHEHLMTVEDYHDDLPEPKEDEIRIIGDFKLALEATIHALNDARELYLEAKEIAKKEKEESDRAMHAGQVPVSSGRYFEIMAKKYWWQMIQLLPSSYNQRRTVMLNYEVLAGIYPKRKDHKLDEWHDFCAWIESLPYSEIITLQEGGIHSEQDA